MARKLNVELIEKARYKTKRTSHREEKLQEIRETIDKNRKKERNVVVIMPKPKTITDQEMPRTRVAAYCRVSTPEDAQVGSFEMQIQHFTTVIKDNPQYEYVKVYTDDGISGTSIERRKGFQEMMADAEAGKIDLILTKSISRFGRNIVDNLTALRKLSKLEPPVTVSFETEGINTSNGENSLVIAILSTLAELESQQKSLSIRSGIQNFMKEGLFKFGVHNLLGYYRDETGSLQIEPTESQIIEYIYESFLEGANPYQIASDLTKQGIRSPKGLDTWNRSTVYSILTNEKYCGDVLYQKFYSKDYITHQKAKNIDKFPKYLWEKNHPEIIKKDTWLKVQDLLTTGKYKQLGKKHSKGKKEFTVTKLKIGPLRGFILLDIKWKKNERETVIKYIEKLKPQRESNPKLSQMANSAETKPEDLKNQKNNDLNIYIRERGISFSRALVKEINYPWNVQFAIEPTQGILAMNVCRKSYSCSIPFSRGPKAQRYGILLGNRNLEETVTKMIPNHNPEERYIISGKYDTDNRIMYFDLTTARATHG